MSVLTAQIENYRMSSPFLLFGFDPILWVKRPEQLVVMIVMHYARIAAEQLLTAAWLGCSHSTDAVSVSKISPSS